MAAEKTQSAELREIEGTLIEMFRANTAIYEQKTDVEQRKDFRRIAVELTHAIMDVRRQRHLEEGNPQFVPDTKPNAQRRYSAKRASNDK